MRGQFSLVTKTLLPSMAVAAVITVLFYFMIEKQQRDIAISQAETTAKAIAKQVQAERSVYAGDVLGKLKKEGIPIVPQPLSTFRSVEGGVPLPASFVLAASEKVAKGGTHTMDLLSLWNINPEQGARTPFESEALKYVAANPDKPMGHVAGEGTEARYYQVTADVASAEACVECHNNHPKSPKHDFVLGDVMGGIIVSLPIGNAFTAAKLNALTSTLSIGGAFLILLAAVAFTQWLFVNRPLVMSLQQLEEAADRISMGDLEAPVGEPKSEEVGRLAKSFERMRVSVKALTEAAEANG